MTQSELKQQFSFMNDKQQEAVFATEGPVLILAGAGSGKTTVLVNRISYILQSGLCNPWNILAITFTNKAAGELKERICSTVPEGGSDIWAATFHSTCARILRRYGDRLGYSSHFTVYATDDQKRLVKDIIKQLQLDEHVFQARSVLTEISKAKDKMITPQEMLKNAEYDYRKVSVAKIYEVYQARLKTVRYKLSMSNVTVNVDSAIIIEGDLQKRIGAPVSQGTELFQIASIENIYVEINVPEGELKNVTLGGEGLLAIKSRPDYVYRFKTERISPTAEVKEQENTFAVRGEFVRQTPPWFRPGMTGIAKIFSDKKTLWWIISHEAIDYLRIKLWW